MSKINKIRLSGTDYDIQDVSATSVVELTKAEYDDLPASAKTDNILYIITDSTVDYVTSAQTQSAITQAVSGKVDTATYAAYTAATDTALASKQTTLTAGSGISISNNVISTTGGGNSVVELTQASYEALVTGGTVDPDTFYIITDAEAGDLTNYYTKSETNTLLGDKADTTALGGLSLVKLTKAEYDALSPNYDSNTLYVING